MAAHTLADLYQMQSLPLEAKISMTRARIKAWVNEFGEDGVYVSFSGGKDSTVLLDIVRNEMGYTNIPAVFVDVPTQYPELREFAKTWDDVEIIHPKISFMEVCEKYGFPLISKEVAQNVETSKKYIKKLEQSKPGDYIEGAWGIGDLLGIEWRNNNAKEQFERLKRGNIPEEYADKLPARMQMLFGKYKHKENGVITNEYSKMYDKSRYLFYLEAPFEISAKCCSAMKKTPAHTYHQKTKRVPITAQMADESRQRRSQWIKKGCNGFNMKIPMSNPMSFWTEQDVLQYIQTRKLPICSVYGDVVEDYEAEGIMDGQVTFGDFAGDKILKTTGCKRTGCMLCGFGCHMSDDTRFLQLKQTHEKMYNLLDIVKNNGVTFREAIEWTNEHGNLNIRL